MSSQEKNIVNTLYHSAVVSGLAIGYAQISKAIMKGSAPRLAPSPYDAGMVIVDVALAMATKELLVKQGMIPEDITK